MDGTFACRQMHRVPLAISEWQVTVLCPDCKHYHAGICLDERRGANDAPCPFDDRDLPLQDVFAATGERL